MSRRDQFLVVLEWVFETDETGVAAARVGEVLKRVSDLNLAAIVDEITNKNTPCSCDKSTEQRLIEKGRFGSSSRHYDECPNREVRS
jgi:hypothetical protein